MEENRNETGKGTVWVSGQCPENETDDYHCSWTGCFGPAWGQVADRESGGEEYFDRDGDFDGASFCQYGIAAFGILAISDAAKRIL